MLTKETEKDLLVYLTDYPLPSSDENQKLIEKIKNHFSSSCSREMIQAVGTVSPELIGSMIGVSSSSIKRWMTEPVGSNSQGNLEMMIFVILLSSLVEEVKKPFSDFQI